MFYFATVAPEGRKKQWPDVAIAHLTECDSNRRRHWWIETNTLISGWEAEEDPHQDVLPHNHGTPTQRVSTGRPRHSRRVGWGLTGTLLGILVLQSGSILDN